MRLLPALAVLVLLALTLGGCQKDGPVTTDELDSVVARLEKGTSASMHAETRLLQTSPYVTWEKLIRLVQRDGASPEGRAAAIRIISATRDSELGLPGAVVQSTKDPNALVRGEAIRAIVRRGDPGHQRVVRDALAAASDPQVKKELEAALVALKAQERVYRLDRMITAREAEERALSVRRMGEVGKKEDVAALTQAFSKSTEAFFKQEVLLALSKIGGEDAKTFVRAQLRSEDPMMRGISAFAETRLKDPACVFELGVILAEEKVGDSRISAATALGLIGTPEAKAALDQNCRLGAKDPRVDEACRTAKKSIASTP